jgi:hypothetical protein
MEKDIMIIFKLDAFTNAILCLLLAGLNFGWIDTADIFGYIWGIAFLANIFIFVSCLFLTPKDLSDGK